MRPEVLHEANQERGAKSALRPKSKKSEKMKREKVKISLGKGRLIVREGKKGESSA